MLTIVASLVELELCCFETIMKRLNKQDHMVPNLRKNKVGALF